MIDFDKMTWTCMVCGEERPDHAISVAVHPVEHDRQVLPGATYRMRYCNDRADCATAAFAHGPYRTGMI